MKGENNYSLIDSATDSVSSGNIWKRVLWTGFFGILLGLEFLVARLNYVGQNHMAWYRYIWALVEAGRFGMVKALGGLFPLLSNPLGYWQGGWWGSVALGVVMFVGLFGVGYQFVSFIINIFDGKEGEVTPKFVRWVITLVIIFIVSAMVYFIGGDGTQVITELGTNASVINSTIQNVTTNMTSNVTNVTGSIISLL